MKKLKELGAPLDGAVVDTEYIGFSTYYLVDTDSDFENLVSNPKLLQQIVKDKRYKTLIRPLLEEYGYDGDMPSDEEMQTIADELLEYWGESDGFRDALRSTMSNLYGIEED